MTDQRQTAIDQFRHAVQGEWLDLVLRNPSGAELSMALRMAQKKTDKLCQEFFDLVVKQFTPAPAINGAPAKTARPT